MPACVTEHARCPAVMIPASVSRREPEVGWRETFDAAANDAADDDVLSNFGYEARKICDEHLEQH